MLNVNNQLIKNMVLNDICRYSLNISELKYENSIIGAEKPKKLC